MSTHIVGIDPGLVHTGVVSLSIFPHNKTIVEKHVVINGPDPAATAAWVQAQGGKPSIFIEGYRPRMKMSTDRRMIEAVAGIRHALPGSVDLDNMGVKKVIKQKLMELLEVWNFSDPTHHQDLRSAARIGLFGAVKDKELNHLLGTVVVDFLDGKPWQVTHA